MNQNYVNVNAHDFEHAFEAMKQGHAAKLPEWKGYWVFADNSIKMHCKDGAVIDIKDTEDVEFTLRNIMRKDWEILVEGTFPADLNITTMTFSEALRCLKRGKKVARKGWNGKGMFLFLLPEVEVPVEHIRTEPLKQIAINNGGTVKCLGSIRMRTADGSVLTGWLASQTDLFAEDWYIVED